MGQTLYVRKYRFGRQADGAIQYGEWLFSALYEPVQKADGYQLKFASHHERHSLESLVGKDLVSEPAVLFAIFPSSQYGLPSVHATAHAVFEEGTITPEEIAAAQQLHYRLTRMPMGVARDVHVVQKTSSVTRRA